jgi:hypothetical protein
MPVTIILVMRAVSNSYGNVINRELSWSMIVIRRAFEPCSSIQNIHDPQIASDLFFAPVPGAVA